MKMKKQDKEVFIILMIIILVIVSIAVLLGVLPKSNEPHFIITKEVCEEKKCIVGEFETNLTKEEAKDFRIELKNKGDCERFDIISTCGMVNACSSVKLDFDNKTLYVKQATCEQVEVDEVKLYCSWIEEENCKVNGKLNLNLEWLEKHCECIEKYNKEKNTLCLVEEGGCETFEYDSCKKYKCEFEETYFVETWSQTK